MADERQVNRKARVGTVVSDVNDQTIVVRVERAARHRLYKKVIRQTKKYHVHDPENRATTGDIVRIEEGRPVSKKKSWHLLEVLTERAVADVAPEALDEELVDEVQRSATRAAAEEAEASAEEATAMTETTPVATASTDAMTTDAGEAADAGAADGAAMTEDTTDDAGEADEAESADEERNE